jgi:hypothetical protein
MNSSTWWSGTIKRHHPSSLSVTPLWYQQVKPLETNIYVNDIRVAAAFKEHIIRLLAATIEAIFLICGLPDITVGQCPLLLEKWFKLIVGPRQIVLGLLVNTDKMTVSLTDKYIQQVRNLLDLWDPNQRTFKVGDMQKLVGKLARLGKGAPWIYKLMSHVYARSSFYH